MALLDFSRSAGGVGAADRAFAPVLRILAAVAAWNDQRRTHRALAQLSDIELEDIGLNRADVNKMAGF